MGFKIANGYCETCGRVKVVCKTPNHILHLFLTIFTGGLWLIIWFILIDISKQYRCDKCGSVAYVGLNADLRQMGEKAEVSKAGYEKSDFANMVLIILIGAIIFIGVIFWMIRGMSGQSPFQLIMSRF